MSERTPKNPPGGRLGTPRCRSAVRTPRPNVSEHPDAYAVPVDATSPRTPPPAEEVAGYLERARALLRRVAEQVGAVPPAAPLPHSG